jgi:hypothetical protein
MKMLRIGAWYSAIMVPLIVLFWHMPDSWRFCDALAKPYIENTKVLEKRTFPHSQYQFAVIGDCKTLLVDCDPSLRFRYNGLRSKQLVNYIKSIPDEKLEKADAIVLIGCYADIWDNKSRDDVFHNFARAKKYINQNFPLIPVFCIDSYRINEYINEADPGMLRDKWHFNTDGVIAMRKRLQPWLEGRLTKAISTP